MGKGKLATQVAHAAVQAAENIRLHRPEWYNEWLYGESVQTKNQIEGKQRSQITPNIYRSSFTVYPQYPAEIYDARKTQLEPLGIGPAPYYKIDPLVKDLKYL